MRHTAKTLAFFFLLAVLVAGCGQKEPITIEIRTVQPCQIQANGTAGFSIEGTLPTGATIEWEATQGTFSTMTGRTTTYTAPNLESDANVVITAVVTSGNTSETRTAQCTILGKPAPTATEPVAAPSETEVETEEPTVEPTLETTTEPVACPLQEVFPQAPRCGAGFDYYEGGMIQTRFVEDPACVHSGAYGLHLEYNIGEGEYGGWGVTWEDDNGFDASRYHTLSFWAKGDAGGEVFELGLRDMDDTEPKLDSDNYVVISADDWRQVTVPLADFVGVDLSRIKNVNISFGSNFGEGALCVDDMTFE
jgi:hypothetical protein